MLMLSMLAYPMLTLSFPLASIAATASYSMLAMEFVILHNSTSFMPDLNMTVVLS